MTRWIVVEPKNDRSGTHSADGSSTPEVEFNPQYRTHLVGLDGNLSEMLVDPMTKMMRVVRDSIEAARYPYRIVFDPVRKLLFPVSLFFRGNPAWSWRLRDITEYPKGTRLSETGINWHAVAAGIFVIGWFWLLAEIIQGKW